MKDMDEVIKDPRFSHIVKDARFKRLPKKHVKVKVDKRFQSMFTNKNFQVKCSIDKRGRPIEVAGSEDLKRYYNLSDSEEGEEESQNEDDDDGEQSEGESNEEDSDGEESEEQESEKESESSEVSSKKKKKVTFDNECELKQDEVKTAEKKKDDSKVKSKKDKAKRKLMTAEIKKKLRNSKIDYARGEGKFLSESSSEEEVSDDEVSDYEEHDWGELDNDAGTTEEATNRLAICHMDWDRIKAVDLMVLFNSFLPAGGLIHSITIYPSEFGIQRMKEEEEKGPTEFKELKTVQEDEEMDREQMEKLRKYQLNRLKYYYAIMVCDSKETANALYKECDGLEYECSAVKMDLRFVPDDTAFDQEPKDTCTALPDLSTYKPRLFQTTALTRSKVELTWDENDPDREDLVRSVRNGNIDENQLKQYLAYSSDDDDYEDAKILINDNVDESTTKPETEQSSIEKYKSLLSDIEAKEKKKKKDNEVNLEVTWNLKLENKANEIVKEKIKEKDNLTPFEQYLDKKKEKKKKKKQERAAQIEQSEKNSEESAFSDDDIPSDIDLNDPYFKEELGQMKPKKMKKKEKNVKEESETEEDKQKKAELELLMLDEGSQDKHFSLKKIQESENANKKKKFKKGKKRKVEESVDETDDFKINVNDERFSALYSSYHFNIDPTDPQYKPTKATKELIEEKLRRRAMDEPAQKMKKLNENSKQKKAELNVLVKNIKKNTAEMKRML